MLCNIPPLYMYSFSIYDATLIYRNPSGRRRHRRHHRHHFCMTNIYTRIYIYMHSSYLVLAQYIYTERYSELARSSRTALLCGVAMGNLSQTCGHAVFRLYDARGRRRRRRVARVVGWITCKWIFLYIYTSTYIFSPCGVS